MILLRTTGKYPDDGSSNRPESGLPRRVMRGLGRQVSLLAVALFVATPVYAQTAPSAQGTTADVVVNLRQVDIPDVAQQISRITGRTIILDPSVQGKINVTSAVPLSPGGVWQLFVTALRGQGFAVVQSGRAWRVVPQANAVREPTRQGDAAQIVTRLIRLRSLEPEEAVRVFRPLIAQFGSSEAVSNPDAIVVTDFADNVARIAALAATLDRSGGGDVSTILIDLRQGSAVDVATAIQGVFGDKVGLRAVPRADGARSAAGSGGLWIAGCGR